MARWLRWHCPPDTGFEIRALAVWGRARYLSVKEAPHNTDFHTWMGKKHFCFFETAETGNRPRTLAWKAAVLTPTLGPLPTRYPTVPTRIFVSTNLPWLNWNTQYIHTVSVHNIYIHPLLISTVNVVKLLCRGPRGQYRQKYENTLL